jgi:hypothetical protein
MWKPTYIFAFGYYNRAKLFSVWVMNCSLRKSLTFHETITGNKISCHLSGKYRKQDILLFSRDGRNALSQHVSDKYKNKAELERLEKQLMV